MTTFDSYLAAIMERAALEAQRDAGTSIEAHHLLLAVAAGPQSVGKRVLTSAGLEYPAVRAALEQEFAHSLGVAGVAVSDFAGARAAETAGKRRPNKIGASTKLALERGFAAVDRKQDIRPGHLLLGILSAEVGTVPHALRVADVDRDELLDRLGRALAEDG